MTKKRSGRRLVQAAKNYDDSLFPKLDAPLQTGIVDAFRDCDGVIADSLNSEDLDHVRRALNWAHSIWHEEKTAPNVAEAEKRLDKIRDASAALHDLIARPNDPDPLVAFVARMLRRHADKALDADFDDTVIYVTETDFFETLLSGLRLVDVAAGFARREVPTWGVGHPGNYVGHLDQLMADVEQFIFEPHGWSVTVITNGADRRAPLATTTFRLGLLLPKDMRPFSESAMISLLEKRRSDIAKMRSAGPHPLNPRVD